MKNLRIRSLNMSIPESLRFWVREALLSSADNRASLAAMKHARQAIEEAGRIPSRVQTLDGGGVEMQWGRGLNRTVYRISNTGGSLGTFCARKVDGGLAKVANGLSVFGVQQSALPRSVCIRPLVGIRNFIQRGTRRWSNMDTWSGVDVTILPALGASLLFCADNANGWTDGYPGEYAAWVRDLRIHGNALADLSCKGLAFGYHDGAVRVAAHARAKAALEWIAEWHEGIWI